MPRNASSALCLSIALFALAAAATANEPDSTVIELPEVTGPHPVGAKVWHWERRSDSRTGELLEVMGQLWYPAAANGGAPARYRPLGGQAFEPVRQHSSAVAPFATLPEKAPVILVCPGRGTSRYYYSSIAEDLASRGFAVLAVDIPRIGHVEFPDGRVIEPSDDYRPSFELITGPYEKVDAFFEPAVALGLAHLELALDRLAALIADDPAGTLTGRLDMQSMGTFGHSLGGRICGALAGRDDRFRAFAAMEGVPPRELRQNGMRAASLQLYSSELPEDMALPNVRELYDNRIAEATILRLEGFGHNSVTDQPLIFPERFNYAVDARQGIAVVREVLSSFFRAHLVNGSFSPAALASGSEVTLIATSVDGTATNQ